MKKFTLVLLTCVLNTFHSNAQSITRLLVASKDDDILRVLDTNNFSTIKSTIMAFTNSSYSYDGCTGLTKNPVTGAFYMVVKDGGDRRIAVLDPLTGLVTDKGILGDNFSAITFNGNTTLLGVTGDGANVPETAFRIDTTNATNNSINFMGAGADGEVICYNPVGNKVYHWSGNGTVFYQKYDTNFVTPLNLPVGSYSGEIFAATYKTNGKFLVVNINSEFRMADTLGNIGASASTYSESIKGISYITCPRVITGSLTFCPGSTTTLTMSSRGDFYQWYRNNTLIAGANSATYAAGLAGYYKCLISDACGVDSLAAGVNVTALNGPLVSITGASVVCPGKTIVLTGSSGGNSQWYLNGAPISGANSNTYAASQPGVYNMVKTNANGCADSAAVSKILISTQPTITVVASATSVCQGSAITFSASGALSYTWSTGNAAVITVTPSTNTTYTVSGSDVNSCQSTSSITAVVKPLPQVTASSNAPVICEGETATLTANGAATFTWNGNQSGNSFVVSPTQNTSYTVSGTDANGCMADFVITQTVSACTGIQQSALNQNQLVIYPNPANGEFSVKSDKAMNLTIINELGQQVLTLNLSRSNNYQAKVNNLSKGIYFIVNSNDKTQGVRKLVIE